MSDQKNNAYENSKIYLDDDRVLVVEPYTTEAANYFHNGFGSDAFRHGNKYLLIIWKEGRKYLVTVFPDGDEPYFKNITDNVQMSFDSFMKRNKKIESIVGKFIGTSELYETLKKLMSGEFTGREREIEDLDDSIYDIRIVNRLPGASRIILKFELDDYLKLLGVNEDYQLSFANSVLGNYYNSWDFGSWERTHSDFYDGYFFRNFNISNTNKLIEIADIILDKKISVEDFENETFSANFAQKLNNISDKNCRRMIDDYSEALEECYLENAKNDVRDQICGVFRPFGFFQKEDSCYNNYFTSVENLIRLYDQYEVQYGTISYLLKKIVSQNNISVNFEDSTGGDCYQWTEETETRLQNKFETELGEILEKILDSDEFQNLEEYRNIIASIEKKFEFNKWYELPKDEDRQIEFVGVDPKTNLVNYNLLDKSKGYGIKRGRGTLEDINLILYHPEIDFGD